MCNNTESVIEFLKSNKDLLDDYFSETKEKGRNPSYSELLIHQRLSGTTKEKVDFTSSSVKRSSVTKWLIGVYTGSEDI